MRFVRWLLTLIGTLTVVVALFLVGYDWAYSMGPARAFELGRRGSGPSVLIATQGSPYKDAVSQALAQRLTARPAHVKVIDVSALPPVIERDWDAMVLMFSWERWQPEPHARAFAQRCSDLDRLIALTTSGGGNQRLPCVDTVTSASEVERAGADATELARRVEAVLARPTRDRDHFGAERPAR